MPESQSDRVERVIAERIESGEYPPGSRLPYASEMRAEFGVSQMVIRTALERLKARGLVEGHAGLGTFVRRREGSGND